MASSEGASYGELLLEAARRDNVELIRDVLQEAVEDTIKKETDKKGGALPEEREDEIAPELINETRDPLGNTVLHVSARQGSSEVLDYILDIEGVEVDPVNRLDKETPLHLAAKFARENPGEEGMSILYPLIDAGADPRLRNNQGKKPIDLLGPDQTEFRDLLQNSEYAHMVRPQGGTAAEDVDEDDGPSDGESD